MGVLWTMLSNKSYANLFDVTPGTLRRDTKGLSAVCLLPPKVKIEGRPLSAMHAIRNDTPASYPYPRKEGLPGAPDRTRQRPQSAAVSRAPVESKQSGRA